MTEGYPVGIAVAMTLEKANSMLRLVLAQGLRKLLISTLGSIPAVQEELVLELSELQNRGDEFQFEARPNKGRAAGFVGMPAGWGEL